MELRYRYICLLILAALFLGTPDNPAHASMQAVSTQDAAIPADIPADSEHIELVGQLGGLAQNIAVQGNYAYAGFGSQFAVLDISNPAAIQRVGWLPAPGEVEDITILADIAYVTYRAGDYHSFAGRTGLMVIDIQNPVTPESLTIQEFTGCGSNPQVITAGSYAYLAYTACSVYGGIIQNNGAYLYQLDISDPTNPAILTSTNYFMSSFAELATMDGWLYALWEDVSGAYLKVFDVSDPTGLVEMTTARVANGSTAIALSGDYAYLAAADNGMQVIELSDPSNPTPVITHTLPGPTQDIFIAEDFAYLSAGEAGLWIVDITDPLNPSEVDSYTTSDPTREIIVSGEYAYLANGWGGLEIVQLADLTQAGLAEPPETINDLAVRDPYGYIAAQDGFWVFDLADPSLPLAVAHDMTETPCVSLALQDDYAYLACPQIGLRIMDITDPLAPSEAGVYDLLGDTHEMVLVNQNLYIARSGLLILDVSNPLAPVEISTFSVDDHGVNALTVIGDHAYLGMDDGNLVVVDISDPSAPTKTGGYDPADRYGLGQEATAIQMQDNIVYLTTIEPPPTPLAGYFAGDTWLIDISEPENPTLISSISTSGAPFDLSVKGGYAAVAYEREGLRLYDITNSTAPVEKGSYNPSEDISGVAAAGDLIYLYNNSLFITEYFSDTTYIYLPAVPQSVSDSPTTNQETLQ
jgi:hypothetical protein